ncbi:hypothetical protein PybrP1_000882 [[Pythium] brassicae (nom. inval.)]|nr:hypothetical protein PybrP1_000882 [[Pythium] brassicae (nom. inval.)]
MHENGSRSDGPSVDGVEPPHGLYRMKGAHRQDIWAFARLSPKDKYLDRPREEMTSAFTRPAYCLLCGRVMPYRVGQTSSLKTHHAALETAVLDDEHENVRKRKRVVSESEQERATRLLARWVARCNWPIAIVEDDGFRDYIRFVGQLGGIDLKLPKRG